MINIFAKCDICKESQLHVTFEHDNETMMDILEAVKESGWVVETLPGPTYILRCQNCQSKI